MVAEVVTPRERSDMRLPSDLHQANGGWRGLVGPGFAVAALLAVSAFAPSAAAQGAASVRAETASPPNAAGTLKPGDSKPYDDKLVRLSEILGAVHYLRELCGQNDGQQWRDQMREILAADGGSALRKAMLTRSFNNGYRSFGRTYQACTPSAQAAIGLFLSEGAQIADGLVKTVP